MAAGSQRSIVRLWASYSLIYLVAVAADHLSTQLAIGQGGSESNPFFRAADGGLLEQPAVIVFVLLWPICLGSLWVGRKRAMSGDTAVEHPLVNGVIGSTAYSAFRAPIGIVLLKIGAAVFNLVDGLLPVSLNRLLRDALEPLGIWSPTVGYVVFAAVILGAAWTLSRRPTHRLAAHYQMPFRCLSLPPRGQGLYM